MYGETQDSVHLNIGFIKFEKAIRFGRQRLDPER